MCELRNAGLPLPCSGIVARRQQVNSTVGPLKNRRPDHMPHPCSSDCRKFARRHHQISNTVDHRSFGAQREKEKT